MSFNPKVSVIIPIYNVEKYLADCLDSVINQSLNELEIICVDDCSTDSSLNILYSYAQKDTRIFILKNKNNRGQSYSRNKGLKKATGKYIYFLDSDDMIVRNTMELLYQTAESNITDVIFFDGTLIYENDSLANKYVGKVVDRKGIYEGVYKGHELFTRLIENDEWSPSPPRQFFSREHLKKHRLTYYEGIVHEDVLFTFASALMADRVTCIKDKLFIRRYRENSTMTSAISQKNFDGHFICYCEMLFFWKKHSFNSETNCAVEKHLNSLLDISKRRHLELERNGRLIPFHTSNKIINHLYDVLILGKINGKLFKGFEDSQLQQLKASKNIIIYGAGNVGREVLEILDKNNISILGFAVSKLDGNPRSVMGNQVFEIDDLTQYGSKCIIIVATISDYYKDITKKLEELGFKNMIYALGKK